MSSVHSFASTTTDRTIHDLLRNVFSYAEAEHRPDEIPIKTDWQELATSLSPSLEEQSSDEDDTPPSTASAGDVFGDEFCRSYGQFSRTSHMGILDPSYEVFKSQHGHGALIYKIKNRTLVVAGDPLCPPEYFQSLLAELRQFRRTRGLRVAFMNVSETFARFGRAQGWDVFKFGRERVLNPLTNQVLLRKGGAGKRIISRNRFLLDPKRGGLTVGIYAPGVTGVETERESELQRLYDEWREDRDKNPRAQAFVTKYDIFSHPDITLFLYAQGQDGTIKGFAGLRSLCAHGGFQIDPCVASRSAPGGTTDMLVVAAMTLLRRSGISYLSLGYEPSRDLEGVSGQKRVWAGLARSGYGRVMQSIPLSGKKQYNDKFRPDEELSSDVYVVLPSKSFLLPVQQAVAVMHVANIQIRRLLPLR